MTRLAIQLVPFTATLRRPVRTAHGELTTCRGVRVRVAGEGGVGWGEATSLVGPGRSQESAERIHGLLAPIANGWIEAPGSLADVAGQVDGIPSGAPAARFGLELALLDWLARRREVSVAKLLSPAARDEVRVNALVDAPTLDGLVAAARAAVQEGFDTLKLKVAARPLEVDLARVEAVREAVGSAVRIRVDANGGWTEPIATRALGALAARDVELCEQPVPDTELTALARLAARGGCPVAADESVPGLWAQLSPLPHPKTPIRIWVLKPAALGGLLPCLRIAQTVRAWGVEAVVTAGWEGSIARAGALHLAAALGVSDRAHGLATGAWIEGPESAPLPVKGAMRLEGRAGLGLTPEGPG